jgi:hypothetical protein
MTIIVVKVASSHGFARAISIVVKLGTQRNKGASDKTE